MSSPVPVARLLRSDVVESTHLGSVVVADKDGAVVASVGDPERPTFIRSTGKPFQAAVSIALAGERPPDEEIAVMAASHNAEEEHLRAVRSLLDRAGLTEGALRCPPGRPMDPDPDRPPEPPARILHNCSGKHAGMLLAAVRRGDEVSSYPDGSHPVQMAVADLMRRATGTARAAVAVDGCGVPVEAVPLRGLATAYARLAVPAALGPEGGAAEAVVSAMARFPFLVAGRGRVCTVVMEGRSGLLVKVGAEGVAGATLLDRGFGVAVKIEDGAQRARDAALLRVLGLLGVVDPDDPVLAPFARPPVRGGERTAGAFEPCFDLPSPGT